MQKSLHKKPRVFIRPAQNEKDSTHLVPRAQKKKSSTSAAPVFIARGRSASFQTPKKEPAQDLLEHLSHIQRVSQLLHAWQHRTEQEGVRSVSTEVRIEEAAANEQPVQLDLQTNLSKPPPNISKITRRACRSQMPLPGNSFEQLRLCMPFRGCPVVKMCVLQLVPKCLCSFACTRAYTRVFACVPCPKSGPCGPAQTRASACELVQIDVCERAKRRACVQYVCESTWTSRTNSA
eukprot:6190681-Pleurochrysis_carterae.AAC.3